MAASEKTRRHSSGMLKKAISKASKLSFLFLNTIPMPSKWKRMEIGIPFFLSTAAPGGTSRHHRKQRRIFIFHPGTTASHVVGGHVMQRSLDCSGCRRNLHLQGGIVLKKRNTRNLQQALLQMTQENSRKILSLAGKQFWCHRYSPKVVYQQWEILFK